MLSHAVHPTGMSPKKELHGCFGLENAVWGPSPKLIGAAYTLGKLELDYRRPEGSWRQISYKRAQAGKGPHVGGKVIIHRKFRAI